MATLYTEQQKNIQKTWILMGAFLAVVVAIGYFMSYQYQSPAIFYLAVILSVAMNVVSYWNSDKIAISLAGGKILNRENDPELFNLVENLSITAGLPMPKIYIIEDPAPNAFATGRDKDHSAIAFTTGLRSMMDKSELEGVAAHELAHIGNRDTLLQTSLVVLVGLISILSDFFIRFSHGRSNNNKAGGPLALIGVVFIILSPIIATIIQLAISRKREFLADATGALLTRYPEGLAGALRKMASYPWPLKRKHNATAHLFIVNPFGDKSVNGLARLFSTHPRVEERIRALIGSERVSF